MCFKSKKPLFSLQEILEHRTKESFWILWKNKVYDITDFYFKHPGGSCIFIHLDATPHMIYHSKSICVYIQFFVHISNICHRFI